MKKTKWKTEADLRAEIDAFFEMCRQEEKVATKISLAVYLGLTKDEFLKLQQGGYDTKKTKFSHVMRMADTKIEEFMENLLFTKEKGHNAIMFYLKSNFGWSEKAEESKGDDSLSVNISVIGEGEI